MSSGAASRRGERAVRITISQAVLDADLHLPEPMHGVVMFAHGSGSSRQSPRNRAVAAVLQDGGFATLLLDLLTPEEEQVDIATREYRFDIALLAGRLAGAIDWMAQQPEIGRLPLGLFGASTGAAAALIAAAQRSTLVGAVVSRGGRPDLAGQALERVRAPTLLIVGGYDTTVIDMNRSVLPHLHCPKELTIVPGATHLFEEPGTLDQVARLACDWFRRYLV